MDKTKAAFDELRKIRDEIKLKIHLASMDARDAFEKLEPKLKDLERQVANAGAAASREVETAIQKAKESLGHIKEKIEKKA
jgi:F0F1-type ATP synthase membrane subunit b/b'